jgi:hypothetical protein
VVKIHRAATVVLLLVLSTLLLLVMLVSGLARMGWGGLVPLGVLVGVSAVVGILISWRRYFPRARAGRQ